MLGRFSLPGTRMIRRFTASPPAAAFSKAQRAIALIAVVVVLLALGGCGSGGPPKRIFPPEARLQELRLAEPEATLLLRVQSFSTVPSTVRAYDLALEIGGVPAGRLSGTASTSLLPQGAEAIEVRAVLPADALARAREAIANRTALRYRLVGTITVEPNGRATPIDYGSALSPAPGLDGVLR